MFVTIIGPSRGPECRNISLKTSKVYSNTHIFTFCTTNYDTFMVAIRIIFQGDVVEIKPSRADGTAIPNLDIRRVTMSSLSLSLVKNRLGIAHKDDGLLELISL